MGDFRDEKQETGTRDLGEITNEDARDPYTHGWPVRSRERGRPYDLASKTAAHNAPQASVVETAKAIEVNANVRATFDSRPVNAYDGILTAIIVVA